MDFKKKLEEETGKNVGFSVVSNIRLASTKYRMDEYHQYAGVAKKIGASSIKDMGKVMGELKKNYSDTIDFSKAGSLLKEILSK